MKRLFIETHYQGELKIEKKILDKLPQHLVLSTTVQLVQMQENIKKQLEGAGKKVELFKSVHGLYLGQVLGCDVHTFRTDADAFLYVGDGLFHPTALLYEHKIPVYCYDPFSKGLTILTHDLLRKRESQKKALLAKFIHAKRIGMLMTTKPGQSFIQAQMQCIDAFRDRMAKEYKEVFVFVGDEVNFQSLESFNFIDVWVNTACPRIVQDFASLNIHDLVNAGLFEEMKPAQQHSAKRSYQTAKH